MGGGGGAAWCAVHVSVFFPAHIKSKLISFFMCSDANTWELADEEYTTWDEFLSHSISLALDHGIDTPTLLSTLAHSIHSHSSASTINTTRPTDLLLSHLDLADARELPDSLMDFVGRTLCTTYPPAPSGRGVMSAMWLVRTVTGLVTACPEGLRIWARCVG